MDTSRGVSEEPSPSASPTTSGAASETAFTRSQHPLNGRRAGLAGGVWMLMLYSLSTALFVMVGPGPRVGPPSWGSVLPGFDGNSVRGIALGFPLSFLYGAGGAWLFALLYNLATAIVGDG